MNFTFRSVLADDLNEILSWYTKDRGWDAPPHPTLLPQGTGYLAQKDGVSVACGFLYMTNSTIAVLEFTATNPNVSPIVALSGLSAMIMEIKKNAVKAGYTRILQFLNNKKFERFYENKLGFVKTEEAALMIWVKED